MKTRPATAPARPRPARMLDAAPVNSAGDEAVADAVVWREAGTERDLLGWRRVELETGYPVLATTLLAMTVAVYTGVLTTTALELACPYPPWAVEEGSATSVSVGYP
jgi:hypothetical protein